MITLEKLYPGGINDAPPKEKACRDCKQVKPMNDFKKSYKNRDGRHCRCRACEKKRVDNLKQLVNPELFVHDKYYSF